MRSARYQGLAQEPQPTMYLPARQNPLGTVSLLIRTETDPIAIAQTVRRIIAAADPQLAIYDVSSLEQALSLSAADRRFQTLLLGAFAVIALILASVGVYGLVSFSVSRRTSEIGIRMALGARAGSVLAMIVGEGLKLTAAGLVVGLAGAFLLAGLIERLLFGVSSRDPVTFVAVSVLLTLSAAAACLVPARRALKIDPASALRSD